MANRCTRIPEIMMPREGTDLSKWAVIACDQYTSQPEYWAETDRIVGDAPSTLRLTLPEVYLEDADVASHIERIHKTMQQYVQDGTLRTLPAGVVLTARWSGGSCPRRGIVLSVDLEAYEYTPGSASLIRPTEKTVVERIPPRLKVRQGACLELPHIMILIDDPDRQIIEPLFEQTASYDKLYDTDLMQNGGHITGWLLPNGPETEAIEAKLEALCDRETFNKKYGCTDAQALLPYAVGDGNNSLATAKLHYDNLKRTLSPQKLQNHPARYTLAEIVNLNDPSFDFEPINRMVFGVDTANFLHQLSRMHRISFTPQEGQQYFDCVIGNETTRIWIADPSSNVVTGTVQNFIDHYIREFSGKVDYVHGETIVRKLAAQVDNIGILFPPIPKQSLFETILIDGALPRKTFSMGTAADKRFYLECRKIKP